MSELQAQRTIAKSRGARLQMANDTATDALNISSPHPSGSDNENEYLMLAYRDALETIQQITK